MQEQANENGIEKLASAAERLRAVRRAQREFLALWAIESLTGIETAVGSRQSAGPRTTNCRLTTAHCRLNERRRLRDYG